MLATKTLPTTWGIHIFPCNPFPLKTGKVDIFNAIVKLNE